MNKPLRGSVAMGKAGVVAAEVGEVEGIHGRLFVEDRTEAERPSRG